MCVFEGVTTTYGQMADRSAALAAGLAERGVGRGDVVGLLSYNCPEFLETVFAANYLGAIAMPINWRLAPPEVRYILERSQARAFVCDDELTPLGSAASADVDGAARISVRSSAGAEWTPLASVPPASAPAPRVTAGADDLPRLMYTSGTTGRPKGVML